MRSAIIAAAAVFATTSAELALEPSLIAAVNAANAGWTAGVNAKFEGKTLDQARVLMGAKRDPARRALLPLSTIAPLTAPPTNFNASEAWPQCASVIGHIRDQSDCGCCWAFGSTEAFNDRVCIVTNSTTLLSPQDTCSCCTGSSGGCNGGFTEDAFNYFQTRGVVTGGDNPSKGSGSSCFPYQLEQCGHHEASPLIPCPQVCSPGECSTPACPRDKCSESGYPTAWTADKHFAKGGAYRIDGVAKVQAEIFTNGPVSASFSVYSDFLTYTGGVYSHVSGSELGGHAVKIYGWGTDASGQDYWLVANSWNNYWGLFGSFMIKRGNDECGIESDIVAGLA